MAVLTLDDYVEARDKQDAAIREEFSKIDSRIDKMEARLDKTLTLDDYIESRNKQDAAIREEFSKIDSRIDKTLTLDDYVEARNKQDAAIREEFSKIDSRIDEVEAHLGGRIDEMGADIKSRFDEMYSVFNHIHWLTERSDATQYNSRARPWMRPKPPPIYDWKLGLRYLSPDECPASVKSFFQLRDPQTPDQVATLVNLVERYDIGDYLTWGVDYDSGSNSDCESDQIKLISREEATKRYPRRAVEKLASLWGLDEESYDDFEARRATLPFKTGKRSRESESPRHAKRPEHGQPKPGSEPMVVGLAHRTSESEGFENPSVIPRSTPSIIPQSTPSVIPRSTPSIIPQSTPSVSHVSPSSGSAEPGLFDSLT